MILTHFIHYYKWCEDKKNLQCDQEIVNHEILTGYQRLKTKHSDQETI